MPPLLQLQKLPGKGDGGYKSSVFTSLFWLTRRRRVRVEKMRFGVSSVQHEQQVIACCQTHSDYGPPKMPLKLTM